MKIRAPAGRLGIAAAGVASNWPINEAATLKTINFFISCSLRMHPSSWRAAADRDAHRHSVSGVYFYAPMFLVSILFTPIT